MSDIETQRAEQIAALRDLEIFRDLSSQRLSVIAGCLTIRAVARGETLVREGESAATFFLVVSGRFEARLVERDHVVAEIGPGQPIGEIAFFAGGARSATVIALRPSTVAEIDAAAFERIRALAPRIERNLIEWLARRLDATTRSMLHQPRRVAAGAVVMIGGGSGEIPAAFVERLAVAAKPLGVTLVAPGAWPPPGRTVGGAIVYLPERGLSDWTRESLALADEAAIVVVGDAPQPPNETEAFAFELIPPARRRLVRLHSRRRGAAEGTRTWLQGREVGMIHHVCLDDGEDVERLARFLAGRANGFVAGGGGAFGVAHIGVYKALSERGVVFDIFGGSSVGAAMATAFALGRSPEQTLDGVRYIFIERRALRRMTLPRYSLLDHRPFDEALRRRFGEVEIEDIWRPCFAVATNLSTNRMHLLRSGPAWRAVRASSSIPGVLPPVFAEDGAMLVDGAIADNVPIEPMAALKAGPNVVVSLSAPETAPGAVDYDRIPGRLELALAYLNPLRRPLPACPGPISVIQKSVFSNARPEAFLRGGEDLALHPPALPGSSFMDWSRYAEAYEAATIWARGELDRLAAEGDPALAALESGGRLDR